MGDGLDLGSAHDFSIVSVPGSERLVSCVQARWVGIRHVTSAARGLSLSHRLGRDRDRATGGNVHVRMLAGGDHMGLQPAVTPAIPNRHVESMMLR